MTAVAAPRAVGVRRTGGPLTGAGALFRFLLRRDRVRIPAWAAGLTVATVGTATNFTQLYPSAAERGVLAASLESPAGVAMTGVKYGGADYTYGVMMGHQMLWFTTLLVALMSVLLVVRHTRTEEATGRAELVRAAVVGRHAPLAAALGVVAVANLAVGGLLALGLGASGVESITWGGSLLYGAAHAAVGLVFAGVAAVAVQITEHPRGASGMAVAVLGLAFALRAVGDVGNGTLSWFSPIGWAQATRVYADDRWWPLLVAVGVTAALVAVAVGLSVRRDVGAGLRRPRPGPPHGSAALASPVGFAFRLHRASLLGWGAGLFLLGAMYGSFLSEAEQWLADIEAMGELLPEVAAGSVVDTFAAMITTVLAIFVAVYAVLATQRLRSEETAGRAEPLLVTGMSRIRWAGGHLAVAMGGSAVLLLAGGLGMGLTAAATTGDASFVPRLVGAALAHVPAVWVVVGVVTALFGIVARAIPLAWAVVLYSFVVVYLGGLLQLPEWMSNLSPFGHVPAVPAEPFAVVPIAALTAVAAGLLAVGLAAFRRRDLQSAT